VTNRLALLVLALVLVSGGPAAAQSVGPLPVDGPQRNVVDKLFASGDTLWAGPQLVYTPDDGASWYLARGVDHNFSVFQPPQAPNAIVYSLDAVGSTVWAGLGYRDALAADNPQSAAGFAFSQDGGQTWQYRFPQLDQPEDTLQVYGVSALWALPIIVPQLSPPFDLAIDPVTRDVWVAGLISGARLLRYDPAAGTYRRRFERVVLPPDTLREISPLEPQFFPFAPQIPGTFNFSRNFLAYSVLVDETGTVWFGTEAGLNRSRPEDVYFFQHTETGHVWEDRAWQRFPFEGTLQGLVGSAAVVLAEQKVGDPAFPVGSDENPRNPIWVGVWRPLATPAEPEEKMGVVVTRDGGESFQTVLLGERVYDFAFCEEGMTHCTPGTVWAAAADGLFTSTDGGHQWTATRDFRDRDRPGRFVRPGAEPRAVAATNGALWVGTTDGLLRSTDGGGTWTILRADVSVSPAEPGPRTPAVDVYAYPNPFSPRANRLVRIRYEREASRIRIFDFGLNLVRTLDAPARDEQAWDGLDDRGARVANGVYFYAVETGGETLWGKILVVE
jgi:hypothetical protein